MTGKKAMSPQAAQTLCYHDHLPVKLALFWAPDLPNMDTQCRDDQKQWLSLPIAEYSITCFITQFHRIPTYQTLLMQ